MDSTLHFRKKHILNELTGIINILEVKMRFIKDFISGKIKVMNVKKSQIVAQLVSLGYPSLKNVSDGEEESEESSDDKKYDILLKMPIYSLTTEKIDELKKKLH